jgi:hypothetical protein
LSRNNLSRLGVADNASSDNLAPQVTQNNTGFNFTAPTEMVELPTKGKYYPEGHPLHNQKTVEIRYMTAKEEDILTSVSLIKNNLVIDRLLQSVMTDKRIDPDYLFIGDKNALIVATRITGYGPEYETQVICPSCYSPSEHAFDLNDINLHEGGDALDSNVEETNEGTFIITLPMSQVRTEVRLLLGKDEKYLAQLANNKKKGNLPETPLTDQFKRVIVSVNGVRDRSSIDRFVDNMPARDSRFLRKTYSKIVPGLDMNFAFDCPKCGSVSRIEVPLGPRFLWPSN